MSDMQQSPTETWTAGHQEPRRGSWPYYQTRQLRLSAGVEWRLAWLAVAQLLSRLAESSRHSISVCWTPSIETFNTCSQLSANRTPARWCTTGNHQHRCGRTVRVMQWCQRYTWTNIRIKIGSFVFEISSSQVWQRTYWQQLTNITPPATLDCRKHRPIMLGGNFNYRHLLDPRGRVRFITTVINITHHHLHHHSRHPSLVHSFTPGSKPIFSINPSHLNTPSTLNCLHDHVTGPDLSCFSIYF